jgi:DNA-directed RNA polymerase subunit RPC12/RpoP
MKIIKAGVDPRFQEIPKTCWTCKTEFTYTNSDVKYDQRDGSYVVCPVCSAFIAHGMSQFGDK